MQNAIKHTGGLPLASTGWFGELAYGSRQWAPEILRDNNNTIPT